MKYATIFSALIFVLGINSAVYLHHNNVKKEIENKHTNEIDSKSKLKTTPYLFHYAGKEKWNNVFALYRLNKQTGEILRYSYSMFEEGKDGTPAYDQVEVLDMATGECKKNTSSDDEFILKLFYENKYGDKKTGLKLLEEKKKKP